MSLVELPSQPIVCKNLVAGQWVEPAGATYLDVKSPYTNTVIGKVPLSSKEDVARVIAGAKAAAQGWRETPLRERTALLMKYRNLLEKNLDRVGNSAAREAGKTLAEGKAGVLKGIEVCDFALSIQNFDRGGSMEVSRNIHCEYRREPLGVVAGIAPFNFPAMVPMWMFPTALTLGNCFVLKPSEKVPLTSQILAELLMEAGFPAGVFSVVNGGRETVEAILDHQDIQAVGFVGSTAAAKAVYERGSLAGKRVLALGGAKNHIILVPDADEAITIPGIVDSFTGCAGQRCMAASVLLAVGDVDNLLNKIVDRAKSIEVGPQMGAIIDKASHERILGYIDRAEKAGAKIVVDGRGKNPGQGYDAGNWMGPTIIDNTTADMEISKSEVFGPVISIIRVPNLTAAMAIENGNPYGNAASVFTTNGAIAQHVADNARAGMIGVNIGVPVPREPFSFGGIQDSKFGTGDITGESSLNFWSHIKKITRKWSAQTDKSWMS